jgi:protease secretion system membrane fusion protein
MSPSPTQRSTQNAVDAHNVIDLSSKLPTDTRPTIRLGLITLIVGFGGFLLWAGLAPLDEGVPALASVTIDTKRKAIQHVSGGIVRRVAVREGQQVKAGDTLVELDDGATRANFESIRQNYMALRASESRLVAEIEGKPVISFHSDLTAAASDPLIRQHIFTQTQLFESRRAALQSELGAMDESIAAQESTLSGIQLQFESRKVQAQKLAEQLKNITELSADGYVPRNQVLQLEQSQAELKAILADLLASKSRTERTIAELKQRKLQRTREGTRESATQLADLRREVQADREKLDAVTAELKRVTIKSPVDGQVVGLSIASLGGVVGPSQKLMDIVPSEEAVVFEVRIPTHAIDRVKAGNKVDVRFSAFSHAPQLVAEGMIDSISADVVTEQTSQGNSSYYLARVSLSPEGLKKLGNHVLQPGMNAEVLIKTGERSLLTYLLHPLTKRIAAAMKEE